MLKTAGAWLMYAPGPFDPWSAMTTWEWELLGKLAGLYLQGLDGLSSAAAGEPEQRAPSTNVQREAGLQLAVR